MTDIVPGPSPCSELQYMLDPVTVQLPSVTLSTLFIVTELLRC
jgi:hypothetical protein